MTSSAAPLRLFAALLLALAATPGAAEPTRTTAAAGPVKVGQPFPTFAGFDLAGTLITSRGLFKPQVAAASSPVALSFFATWCKPCERHLPELVRAVKAAGARLVLVDVGDEEASAVRAFVDDRGAGDVVVLADRNLTISQRAGVTKALPRTFVLDTSGTVRAIFECEGDDFEGAVAQELSRASAAAPPARAAAQAFGPAAQGARPADAR